MTNCAFLTVDEYVAKAPYCVTEIDHRWVRGTRLVFLDLPAIRSCYGIGASVPSETIEDAFQRAGSSLSMAQLAGLRATQNALELEEGTVRVLRPRNYGRAAILAAAEFDEAQGVFDAGSGLVDVKGSGVMEGRQPRPEFQHNNGFLFLDEALVEFVFYDVLAKLAQRDRLQGCTILPYLGLVDLGFSVRMPNLPSLPAVQVLRAPHYRMPGNEILPLQDSSVLPQRMVRVEKALNAVGLSSSAKGYCIWKEEGAFRFRFYEWDQTLPDVHIERLIREQDLTLPFRSFSPNVQFCDRVSWRDESSDCLVDFGHYKLFGEEAGEHGVQRVRDAPLNWGVRFRYRSHAPAGDQIDDDPRAWLTPQTRDWLRAQDADNPYLKTWLHGWALSATCDYVQHRLDGPGLHKEVSRMSDIILATVSQDNASACLHQD